MICRTSLVAPYVGAWIETSQAQDCDYRNMVAPYVGAWIETEDVDEDDNTYKSHPTWVRGLKHSIDDNTLISLCRTLRGCVD